MATNFLTNNGAGLLLSAGILGAQPMGPALKWMLVTGAYVPDRDHVYASAASAAELSCANYVPGYAGGGRKSLVNAAVVVDHVNNRAYITADPAMWASLGTNETVAYALLIYETGGADGSSPILAVCDCAATLTSGDFTWQPGASLGYARINC